MTIYQESGRQGYGRHGSVPQGFERSLRDAYGHSRFSVDEIGEHSGYRVREDRHRFLQPLIVHSRALNTLRAAGDMGARWDGYFFLMRQLSGQLRLRFADQAPVALRAGDVLLMNPYQACELNSRRANEVAVFPVPFDFAGGEAKVLAACGRRLDGHDACAGVLASTLGAVLRGPAPAEGARQVMRDVLASLLAHVVNAEPSPTDNSAADNSPTDNSPTDNSAADATMQRARRFALRDLANPALSPDTIAAGIGVSRRHLYRAFAEHGATPANWIWALRTEAAHQRLSAPDARDKSLTYLAFEAGFNDMAHFSRSHRAKFGCTPGQTRQAALGA